MSSYAPYSGGTGLAQRPFPPVGNSFTTTAATAVQLSKETGAPTQTACLAVWVQNPATTDAGVAQNDGILVGWANPGAANTAANFKPVRNLQPGDPPFRIPVADLSLIWIKPASNTPIAKYWLENGPSR